MVHAAPRVQIAVATRFDLTVETYEEGGEHPVVTHVFHGKTPEQAVAFYRAHLKSDKFLRDCVRGRFGKMPCRNVMHPIVPRRV